MNPIPFNKPFFTGTEELALSEAVRSGHVSGNGPMTRKCRELFESEWGFRRVLLTSSCTDALEMAAMLLDIRQGDEVIVPSYTFVSTALAFARQGATIVFADSNDDNPCIDVQSIEALITPATKAIIPVHYAGIACDMDPLMSIAEKYKIAVVEDAAHAFGAKYKGKLLGTAGHLGCFSFHETKVIHCGEGGMLSVNDDNYSERAEILWEKGTNRCSFARGEVNKYEWIDTGSSFLMSDISAAFLLSQINHHEIIFSRRKLLWDLYHSHLSGLASENLLRLPVIPDHSVTNYSGFYITLPDNNIREKLRKHLNTNGIQAVTHYLDLSLSPYIKSHQAHRRQAPTVNSIRYQDTLLRLPMYHTLATSQVEFICSEIHRFFTNAK
ncbi:MAG: dTDP-4-amino-4,6-dideoxygalactose transaminase [Bacteroidales bacterium]|nr:dTDP-4-amino-4,6-dideoxygalactose transaminase [Bacteroidales bacterium]